MRLKDIEVGEFYAWSRIATGEYPERVEVLEVGVFGTVRDDWHSRESERPTFVKIRRKNGMEDAVVPRQILRPWSEHEEMKEKERREAARREAENAALVEKIKTLAEVAGVELQPRRNRIGEVYGTTLPMEGVERLLERLADLVEERE